MMKKLLIAASVLIYSISAFAGQPYWGKTGHRTTAEIASHYLSKSAQKQIAQLLNHQSLALVSTYGDDIKSDHSYDAYKVWHYINIADGQTYEEAKASVKKPNIITAINECIAGLKSDSTPRDKKVFYLKMLVHLMGDLHQPLHAGHPEDYGGNKIIVFWFDEVSNLHRVWDEDMINSYQMSYSELAQNRQYLSKQDLQAMQAGTLEDWLSESLILADKVYDSAENGWHLSYKYMYNWMPVVRQQLQKGGVRLAKVLNEIFD